MINENDTKNLTKSVGLVSAILTVVGSLIGGGVFFKPQAIYTATGGAPGLGMFCWVIAGVITICGALTVSELAVSIPKTGGMIVYIRELYGERLSFLAGWVQVFLYFPGMIAALAVVFSEQFVILSGIEWMKIPMTLIMVGVLCFTHMLGGKKSAYIGNIATVSKIAVLAIIIVAGLAIGGGGNSITTPFVGKGVNPVVAGGQVLLAVFFVFDGWINVCALAGEMKNPSKDLSKAMVGGIGIVLFIYLAINVAYLKVLPASTLANSQSPGLAVATELFGNSAGSIIGIGIMISVFGCASAFSFTGSRVLYALAGENILPKSDKLLELNKYNAPKNSILLMCVISALFALSGQFNLLSDVAIFSIWIFIVLTFLGVFKNRKLNDVSKFKFKVPLYPIVPIIAIAAGVFVLSIQLITSTAMSIGSIAILLCGVPIYNSSLKRKMKSPISSQKSC